MVMIAIFLRAGGSPRAELPRTGQCRCRRQETTSREHSRSPECGFSRGLVLDRQVWRFEAFLLLEERFDATAVMPVVSSVRSIG